MATALVGSGSSQGVLWGASAGDWAEVQEPMARPMFEAAIGRFGTVRRVLDVGCGSGFFARMIADRGIEVTGLDASEQLLEIARRRTREASFHHGEMEGLPFDGQTFDLVTAIHSLQYAGDPQHALREARRVTKDGGRVFVVTWGLRVDCEAADYLDALGPLLPPAPPNAPGPFALADRMYLQRLTDRAALTPQAIWDVDVPFIYPDLETALRGLLSTGPAALAIQTSGVERVKHAVAGVLRRFKLESGGYLMENRFRLLEAVR